MFLVVLMLIEGWRLSPIAAAAAVSVLPACALLSAPLARRVPAVEARAAAGAILIAGGLAALGLLPHASVVLTFPPQALVGVGLALTLSALTEAALAGRAPQAIHGGWTIASRHAGVVVGLLLLTPVFTADLETERANAEAAGTAALLDARLSPRAKIQLAGRIAHQIDAEGDKVPKIAPAFEPLPPIRRSGPRRWDCDPRSRTRSTPPRRTRSAPLSDCRRLRRLGADPDRDRPPPGAAVSGRSLVGVALAAATALVAVYLVLGGGSYEPTPVADPCAPREWRDPHGVRSPPSSSRSRPSTAPLASSTSAVRRSRSHWRPPRAARSSPPPTGLAMPSSRRRSVPE